MHDVVNFLSEQVQSLGYWIYLITFLLALSETIIGVGLITPGSTLLLGLGAISVTIDELPILNLIFFAMIGAVLGDNINYWLGKKFGEKWTKDGFWIIKPLHFEIGKKYFEDHGGKSVFLGRFVPMVKEIIPFIAGASQMRQINFMFYNFIGAVGWAFEFLGLGFLFAGSIIVAERWIGRIELVVLLFLILLIASAVKSYKGIYSLKHPKTD